VATHHVLTYTTSARNLEEVTVKGFYFKYNYLELEEEGIGVNDEPQ